MTALCHMTKHQDLEHGKWLSRLLWMCQISNICEVSDSYVREYWVVGKCFRNFLVPCFWSGCVWKWRYVPQTVHVFFVHKKYTTYSTEGIVPLWSVNKIFPESCDFTATYLSFVKMNMINKQKLLTCRPIVSSIDARFLKNSNYLLNT